MAWRDFVCWWTCIPLAPSIYTISFLYSCTKLSTTCKNVGVYSGVLFLWNGGRFFIVIHCELYNFKAEVFKQVYSWKKVTLIHIVSISLALVSTNVSTDSISLHQLSNRVIIEDNWTQRNVSFFQWLQKTIYWDKNYLFLIENSWLDPCEMRSRVNLVDRTLQESLRKCFHNKQLHFIFSCARSGSNIFEWQIAFCRRTLESHLK